MDEARIERVIDAAYAGALAPERWPDFLADLAGLFRCHFADSFARAQDYSWFAGTGFGLDEADYRDEFLGKWAARNVWGRRKPVRVAGEIVTTREMVPQRELIRSDMHREYLGPRDLDEGLRLALRAEDDVIQDISLLRAWSAGPYDAEELQAAHKMLPHLQRCAAIANRLDEASTRACAAEAGLEALRHPVLMLDAGGRPIRWNGAADRLLARRDGLLLEAGGLAPSERKAASPLRHALGRASGAGPRKPRSASLSLPPLRPRRRSASPCCRSSRRRAGPRHAGRPCSCWWTTPPRRSPRRSACSPNSSTSPPPRRKSRGPWPPATPRNRSPPKADAACTPSAPCSPAPCAKPAPPARPTSSAS